MIAHLKRWLPVMLPVAACGLVWIAAREHTLSRDAGYSASVEVGGLPLSEIGAGLAALATLGGSVWAAWRKGAVAPLSPVSTESELLAGLAAIYWAAGDFGRLDKLKALAPEAQKP